MSPVLTEERPTQVITLPVSKGKVTVKTYLNAFEKQEIERAFRKGVSIPFNPITRQPGNAVLDMENQTKSVEKMLELMVVDWDFTDGEGAKIEPTLENLQKLNADDYDFLVVEVDKTVNPVEDKSKKKSN